MKREEMEEFFILEEKCDSETMRTAMIHSDELFSVNDITIAVKGNYLYSVLGNENTYMEYEDKEEAKAVFNILKRKLQI